MLYSKFKQGNERPFLKIPTKGPGVNSCPAVISCFFFRATSSVLFWHYGNIVTKAESFIRDVNKTSTVFRSLCWVDRRQEYKLVCKRVQRMHISVVTEDPRGLLGNGYYIGQRNPRITHSKDITVSAGYDSWKHPDQKPIKPFFLNWKLFKKPYCSL